MPKCISCVRVCACVADFAAMETLFLRTGTQLSVKLHPLVVFSILDHYIRRNEGQMRVIGVARRARWGSGGVVVAVAGRGVGARAQARSWGRCARALWR